MSYASNEMADRQKNCMDKLTWQSRELAAAAAAYARYQYGDADDRPRPYRCKFCDKWHLGRRD